MASEYTPNYNLDKYVGTDKPNLRDQYNSAMDKIDAQFVVIENDHTETNNQISAINTNMTQLGERVTTAEKTADNAMSLASTNEGDIATLDSEMVQVQQGVTSLQAVTRSQVLLDASGKTSQQSAWFLKSPYYNWNPIDIPLQAAIPEWANWLDVYVQRSDTYYGEGAASGSLKPVTFMTPIQVATFPLNEYYVESGNVKVRRVNKFSINTGGSIETVHDGTALFNFTFIPFMINGSTLTQNNMGIAIPASDSERLFNNGEAHWGLKYSTTGTPEFQDVSGQVVVRKIVARA
jgi:hypothetical protein